MTTKRQNAEFPEQADENRRIWDANALWWDDRIGDGNDFQTVLIEPATERLLNVVAGDTILDAACGAGRAARTSRWSRTPRSEGPCNRWHSVGLSPSPHLGALHHRYERRAA